jgi:uncharacterized membrane protein
VGNITTEKETTDSPETLSDYDRRAVDRLIFFSDAVFAIAITLLALGITVPVIRPDAVETELSPALLTIAPKLYSYALSFLVIGAYWMAHQRTFGYVVRYDRGLAWLNLLFLLFVALIPFPTEVLGAYGGHLVAVLLYAATITIIGFLLCLLWIYISHNYRLLPKTVTTQVIRTNTWRSLTSPIVFLASIAVAFISIPAAEVMWVLTFVINVVLERLARAV